MVVGVCLMLWAGWHNLRARKLALQEAQANKIVLTPSGTPGKPGAAQAPAADADSSEVPMRGKKAPAFTLATLDGKKVSLADYKGRPVLVNFWATWCAPCKLEMPWFEEFRQKYSAQGFEILGISEDDSPKEDIAKAVKRINVTYPILLTDGKVAPAYGGVDYLPESFYVGRDGVVQIQSSGLASKDEVEANIKRLIAGGNTAPANSVAATATHPAAMLLPSAVSTH
jgi:thiol-disulfide isomerase/thioredoxin